REPMLWLLMFFVIQELFDVVLKDTPGIARAGQKAKPYALVMSVALSGIALLCTAQFSGNRSDLESFIVIAQFVNGSLTWYGVLLALYLVWFPIQFRRNVKVHSAVLMAYLAAR